MWLFSSGPRTKPSSRCSCEETNHECQRERPGHARHLQCDRATRPATRVRTLSAGRRVPFAAITALQRSFARVQVVGHVMPLQPSEAERKMDPRVVGASPEEVVVLWQQRGLSPNGERFDGPVVGLYRLRGGKLARAQMFYFDTPGLIDFLGRATIR